MADQPSGLWTPSQGVAQLRHRPRTRTVIIGGRKAKVTTDDSGTVTQVEFGDRLDAIVRPNVIQLKIRRYWSASGQGSDPTRNPEGPLKGRDTR